MSHRSSAPNTSEGSLQRGKACLSCRRRKMRCDGQRPYCSQCIRGNRAEDCEYTDNQGRTRTQMLEEHVALLQARVHELENPRIASQSVRLHDPYIGEQTVAASRPMAPAPSSMAWWEAEEPPAQMIEILLGIFVPHAGSLGFALSTERFVSDLRLPIMHPHRPHPALVHSVLLWAIRLSGSFDFVQHENLYLQRSILALQDALRHDPGAEGWMVARRRLHAMQAEVLLTQYFFSCGRLLEGRYHANAAASLAVSCGLHRISSPADAQNREASKTSNSAALELAPATSALSYGERLRVFWTIYVLDRCWSAALGAPCVLTDDSSLGTQIESAWPLDISDYEQPQIDSSFLSRASDGTIRRFLSGELPRAHRDGSLSQATLRIMASVVFERAVRLSQAWASEPSQGPNRTSMRNEMQTIAQITTQFARTLIPVEQLLTSRPDGRETLLLVHALAHAAMMTLHTVRASDAPAEDLSAINSALTHASEIVKIIEGISGDESTFIDPILSIVGFSAAQTFTREEQRVRRAQENRELTPSITNRLTTLRAGITRLTNALQRCSDASGGNTIFSQQADETSELLEDE